MSNTSLHRLHEQFCDYSVALKGNTPRTIKWLRETFRYFLKGTDLESIEGIDQRTIQQYFVHGKIEKCWSAKTIKNRLSALSLFFDWCVLESIIATNPCEKIPRPKLPKQIPRHLSKEEALDLLDWTKNFQYTYQFERFRATAIIATFIFTGIRLQELMNLRMIDINFETKLLMVKAGKGEKDRMIPLNNDLIDILRDYLKDRDRLKKSCPFFFTSLIHDRCLDYGAIKRLVDKLRKRSKIHFTPHMLRHTFATLMLEGGCDIFALSKMMGHSDIKTTTLYLTATTGHLQEQIGKHALCLESV